MVHMAMVRQADGFVVCEWGCRAWVSHSRAWVQCLHDTRHTSDARISVGFSAERDSFFGDAHTGVGWSVKTSTSSSMFVCLLFSGYLVFLLKL